MRAVTPASWLVVVLILGVLVIGVFASRPDQGPAGSASKETGPSLSLRGGSACVGVDEFNETARYVGDHYSLKDGLRLRDMDATARDMASSMIVMKQMNARGRGACQDLDALLNHRSAELLRHAGLP